MNRQILQRLASDWVRLAKNDIRTKVRNFMRETESSPRDLAYILGISEGEMQQILEGNGEITLSTFARLLIATGNALEIKPIEATPMGNYENIPSDEEMQRAFRNPHPRRAFEETMFRPRRAFEETIFHPRHDEPIHNDLLDEGDYNEDPNEVYDEGFVGTIDEAAHNAARRRMNGDCGGTENLFDRVGCPRRAPSPSGCLRPSMEEAHRRMRSSSPFDAMPNERLASIIHDRLWDSEIDVNCASREELIEFLKEKDKRMNENKRMREMENDRSVIDFKNRLKNTLKNNPHLREMVKKLIEVND